MLSCHIGTVGMLVLQMKRLLLNPPSQCQSWESTMSIYLQPLLWSICGNRMEKLGWPQWGETRMRIPRSEGIQNMNTKFSPSAILLEWVLLTACQVNDWVWNCVLSACAVLCINTRNLPCFSLPDSGWKLGSGFPVHFGTEVGNDALEF